MASHYQKKYGKSLMFYERTIHLKLFGDLKGKKLLDLGCGGGQTSVFFAKKGATVTGIDFSQKQIDFAKELAEEEKLKISFLQGKIENLSVFKGCTYDLINSSHAIHYVRNLQECFDEAFRVLKPGGKFVFSVSHPLNHITETKDGCLIIKRSYFQKGKYEWNWEYPKKGMKYHMYLYTRKVSDYFAALKKSGFIIEDLLEPKTDLDKNSPWYSQEEPEEEMIPGALIFGARKPKRKIHQ